MFDSQPFGLAPFGAGGMTPAPAPGASRPPVPAGPPDAGSCLSHPFRVDHRGTLATVETREAIAREAIIDLIETRPGERVMLPGYGVRDYAFHTVNAGFASRLAFHLRRQILDYVPDVEVLDIRVAAGDDQQVEVQVGYRLRGGASHSLVYPLWRLRA